MHLEPSRLRAGVAAAVSLLFVSCGSKDADRAPRLEPARVGTPVPVGPTPSAVAVGGGAVWVVDASAGTLSRVDATTRRPSRSVRVPGGPLAVAVGEGAAWVAAGDGSVSSYDLDTGRPNGRDVRVASANGLAVGDGAVWVTSRRAGTVTRIDARTRRADRSVRVGAGPADVAVGAGGVWVLNAAEGSVSRIDPETGRADAPIGVGAPLATALAISKDGIWVARARGEFAESVDVVRIDPESGAIDGDAIPVKGAVPLDLASSAGSVWVTDAGDRRREGAPRPGGVTRIDAARRRVNGAPLRTGDGAAAVAVGEGAVWVVDTGAGTLVPIVGRLGGG